MIHRSLVLALAAALSPMAANATDLLQVYEMARNGDPQLAVAESTRLVNREGQVQARAALLPQLDGSAGYTQSHRELEASDAPRPNSASTRFRVARPFSIGRSSLTCARSAK